jgi:hypothetical protein
VTFARPFNLTLPDGTVLHGAEYPDGFVACSHPDGGLGWAAISMEALLDRLPGGIVQRPEEPTP